MIYMPKACIAHELLTNFKNQQQDEFLTFEKTLLISMVGGNNNGNF